MISQLSAKYQIGAIHTSFLSVKVHPSWVSQAPRVLSYTQRILCDGLSPNPSEKVHRLFPPSIVQTQFGDTLNRCSRRFQIVSWPNLTLSHTQTGYTLKPCTRRFQVVSWPNLTLSHTQTGYTLKPCTRRFQVVSWPNLTVLHTQTGYTLKPCTRRFQVVSWPNLTVLHTQTGYTLKPWHRHQKGANFVGKHVGLKVLNLHRHDLAVAHRGAGLVCYSVTYLEYKSACRAFYAIPLSHISDIRELARNFLESDRELYFKSPINIHGKLDAPSLIKYKVTPGGVIWNMRRKQLIHFYCVALIL